MGGIQERAGKGTSLVEPVLGWTYLSREALARAKAQMDEESMGVRDEIGFLTIHQRYADHFFPGTSVLHTRARYLLFVPWLFEDLAGHTGPAAQRLLRERERVLAGRLRDAGESQVIGGRIFPKPSSQPPSTVYWNALAAWGILRSRIDGKTISRAMAHRMLTAPSKALDDDKQPLVSQEPPFMALPARPENWLEGDIDLRMASAEAEFLRERLGQLRRHGVRELSLLARLVRAECEPPDEMWSDGTLALAQDDRPRLERARQASRLAGIGRAVYDALLESTVESADKREIGGPHRDHLRDMLEEHGTIAASLELDLLERDLGPLPARLHDVVHATHAWIQSGSGDPGTLLAVYTAAEARKGPRARLARTPDGRARRLEWAADEHRSASVLHYRWEQVHMLLSDLAAVA